jgi:hypothetical protein
LDCCDSFRDRDRSRQGFKPRQTRRERAALGRGCVLCVMPIWEGKSKSDSSGDALPVGLLKSAPRSSPLARQSDNGGFHASRYIAPGRPCCCRNGFIRIHRLALVSPDVERFRLLDAGYRICGSLPVPFVSIAPLSSHLPTESSSGRRSSQNRRPEKNEHLQLTRVGSATRLPASTLYAHLESRRISDRLLLRSPG